MIGINHGPKFAADAARSQVECITAQGYDAVSDKEVPRPAFNADAAAGTR